VATSWCSYRTRLDARNSSSVRQLNQPGWVYTCTFMVFSITRWDASSLLRRKLTACDALHRQLGGADRHLCAYKIAYAVYCATIRKAWLAARHDSASVRSTLSSVPCLPDREPHRKDTLDAKSWTRIGAARPGRVASSPMHVETTAFWRTLTARPSLWQRASSSRGGPAKAPHIALRGLSFPCEALCNAWMSLVVTHGSGSIALPRLGWRQLPAGNAMRPCRRTSRKAGGWGQWAGRLWMASQFPRSSQPGAWGGTSLRYSQTLPDAKRGLQLWWNTSRENEEPWLTEWSAYACHTCAMRAIGEVLRRQSWGRGAHTNGHPCRGWPSVRALHTDARRLRSTSAPDEAHGAVRGASLRWPWWHGRRALCPGALEWRLWLPGCQASPQSRTHAGGQYRGR